MAHVVDVLIINTLIGVDGRKGEWRGQGLLKMWLFGYLGGCFACPNVWSKMSLVFLAVFKCLDWCVHKAPTDSSLLSLDSENSCQIRWLFTKVIKEILLLWRKGAKLPGDGHTKQ